MTRHHVRVSVALLVGAVTATGCGAVGEFHTPAPPPPPAGTTCLGSAGGDLAIAVGARANRPAPQPPGEKKDYLPAEIRYLVERTAHTGIRITLVRVDGEPTIANFGEIRTDASGIEAWRQDKAQLVNGATTALTAVRADPRQPEADPLAALGVAGRTVAPGGTVILLDSGLQTTAPLDFREEGMLFARPEDIVGPLTKARQLPDLTDRTVVLVGIGETAPTQKRLGEAERANLIDVWRLIAKEAKARCVEVIDRSLTHAALPDMPNVSTVPIPEPTPPPRVCGDTRLQDAGSVKFVPDQAVFRDPAAARRTLEQFARQIIDNRVPAVELIGTTSSWGTEAGRLRLSRERANTVKAVLVDLGVPAGVITTRGVGWQPPWTEPDRDKNHDLVPGPAARNRSVIVRYPPCR